MVDESVTDDGAFPTETDVDVVLAEFGDDHRAAIRALLHDVAVLAADYELPVSRGYMRRGTIRLVNMSQGVSQR